MDSKHPPSNNHNNHHRPPSSAFPRLHPPPDFSRFRNHLRPGGYMSHAYSGSQIGGTSNQWVNDYHRHPIGMHEAIWRQLEKERIREEIIAEELARRHILEAEVRRELMIERNLAMQRGGDGSFYTSHLKSTCLDQKGFPTLPPPQKMDESPNGEMTGMSAVVKNEFRSLETASQRVAEPRTSEFVTPSDTVKEKENIILWAKPKDKSSGMKQKSEILPSVSAKRKAEVLPSVSAKRKAEVFMSVGDGEPSAGAALNNKVKEAWSCALCQISATSERAFNEHLQGKKHITKETGLRKNGKNFSIGLYPKTISMPDKVPQIPSSTCPKKRENFVESKNPSPTDPNSVNLETNDDPAVRNRQLDKKMKKEAPACRKRSRKRVREEKNFKFWCEMCRVGAYCETVMEMHRKGKKHHALLLEQNTAGKPSTQVMQVKQEINLTEEAGEVVEDTTSGSSAAIIEEVKLDGYQKEAVEDSAPKGLGVVADEVQLEVNQNEVVKNTTSENLGLVTDEVELEGEKKEAGEDIAPKGSGVVADEVQLEVDQNEVLKDITSENLGLVTDEVELEGKKKEAGEDIALKCSGVVADEVQLEVNQNEILKYTTSEYLGLVPDEVELEGEMKEAGEEIAPKGSIVVADEVHS